MGKSGTWDRWKDIPVKLNTEAKEIKWGGQGVQVETNKGTISAKACVVTVSTGVLNAKKIKFTPDLSLEKYESFSGISMGVYNHIALQFKKNFFDIKEKYSIVETFPERSRSKQRNISIIYQ